MMVSKISISCCTTIITVILLVPITIVMSFQHPVNYIYGAHQIETRSPKVYCGNELITALAFVCQNTYNKRNNIEDQENSEKADESNTLMKLMFNSDAKFFHRNLRGVVDECCRRACSLTTLTQYCA